ncbi:hypothetical protein [Nocardiopsis sp. CC223A]|uniref:hypothetical protein n=1 Tax=Nocardiopsis sp. CC223A TaxID=3044051 RepID=UPI00278C7CA6|nr:hypothetical protein [Nocardiopsis sp. CC223A]
MRIADRSRSARSGRPVYVALPRGRAAGPAVEEFAERLRRATALVPAVSGAAAGRRSAPPPVPSGARGGE